MKWLLSILAVSAVVVGLGLVALGAREGRGRVTGAVELEHPPSAVFPFLVQPGLRKQWMLGVEDIAPVGDPTLRGGARSRVVLESPERMETVEEILVVEQDKRVLLQRVCSHPPFQQRLEYALKDLGGGRTLVTAAIHTGYQGLVFNLLEPLLTRAAQSRMDLEIEQLRTATDNARPAVGALPVVSTPVAAAPPTPTPPAPTPTPAPTPPPPAAPPVEEKPPAEPPPEVKPPAEEAPPPSDQQTP